MFERLKRNWMKKLLKEPRYAFLFDTPPKDEVVVFDTETTGLDIKKDEIISIGAVRVKGNRILTSSQMYIKVKCDRAISEESIKIHQIRVCDMEDALDPDEAMDRFLRFIGPRPLVGYYLEFDVAMINKWIKPKLGVTLPNQLIEVSALYYDKKIGTIPQGHVDLRFDTIIETLDIPKLGKHDALNDAIMTAMMYIKLKHVKKL
ncbi:3'-5' exonuclease [Hydrogenimonas cancrithermarum]|uniref:3'-5' exonuclease n=1 Tax=Hydrogenimonas cancrithermarum TaxID=2993563 RepID=A0ABN6WZC0_9BACT|nr:3'-5' exonuclease [Hydrogenimonas cancrithermarum]BDY13739.1 3'-5' exonuclease [Hydrogenimonas cancrithermarum]